MKILTIISNYNEAAILEQTILDVLENASVTTDILVIDNGSIDRSMEIVRKMGVEYVEHCVNTGSSQGVIRTAMLFSRFYDYDVYCHIDGDFQHKAEELNRIVKPLLAEQADIVIGSRFIQNNGFQSYLLRRIGIKLFSKLLSLMIDSNITDITSGFNAYNRKSISQYARLSQIEFVSVSQWWLTAALSGMHIKEVAVSMRERKTGVSEFNVVNSIKFPFYETLSLIGLYLHRPNSFK